MTTEIKEIEFDELQDIFNSLVKNQYIVGNSSYEERKEKLVKLENTIRKYRTEIQEALKSDYGRHSLETDMVDFFPILSEIKLILKNLRKWISKQKIGTPLALFGSSSYILHEPKGVVLIISPWNFPFNLSFIPLASAIAAGNTIVLKPSEMTPYSSALIKKIVSEVFDENEVITIEGGIETSTHLLSLPFNHIFFTGAPEIGKIVMSAASKNLASVTLELGGKSPTIVDETADIEVATSRICQAKFTNNGQICIAPDYVFVHNSKKEQFQNAIIKRLKDFYNEDPKSAASYCRMVSLKHAKRIDALLIDALNSGARVIYGGDIDVETNYVSPTLIIDPNMNSRLMKEEIFGPLLPVIGYDNINEVIGHIQSNPKPLGLYIFSKNQEKIDHIINNTRAGGGCINHCAIHFYNHNMAFGGSNNSGIGRSHGFEGFKEFANARSILKQNLPTVLDRLVPPYDDFKQKIVDFTIKYL
jgi:aldehyde dehydrogenase (NAD+)